MKLAQGARHGEDARSTQRGGSVEVPRSRAGSARVSDLARRVRASTGPIDALRRSSVDASGRDPREERLVNRRRVRVGLLLALGLAILVAVGMADVLRARAMARAKAREYVAQQNRYIEQQKAERR